jgi:hypothetical protein
MYSDPNAKTDRMLSEILNAAEGYREGLSDRSVIERLNALVSVARQGRAGTPESAVGAAREALGAARQRMLDQGYTSFFADLADRAANATLIEAIRRPDLLAVPATTVETFSRNLLAASVAHLVARDLSSHVGEERTARTELALEFRRQVVAQARDLVDEPSVQSAIEGVARTPRRAWRSLIRLVWRLGTEPQKIHG